MYPATEAPVASPARKPGPDEVWGEVRNVGIRNSGEVGGDGVDGVDGEDEAEGVKGV